jgi:hypothetical protein
MRFDLLRRRRFVMKWKTRPLPAPRHEPARLSWSLGNMNMTYADLCLSSITQRIQPVRNLYYVIYTHNLQLAALDNLKSVNTVESLEWCLYSNKFENSCETHKRI